LKFPIWLRVFGDRKFRGVCPVESADQITFFAELRKRNPALGKLALHPKNEGKRQGAAFQILAKDKAMGLSPGASDIIIPLGFVCELKRKDHTKSGWEPGQIEYLEAVQALGGFACVALGWEAALEAVDTWLKERC
jgi:hypothetical protein